MNMVVHPQIVQLAHQYGCAAAKQGKFVAFKDAWWAKAFEPYKQSAGHDQSSLGEDNIRKLAAGLRLDMKKLEADAHSEACAKRVTEDEQELSKFRVNGTPAFFINGQFIGGGIPKEAFKQVIDEKLAIAKASGVPGSRYYQQEIMGKGVHQFRNKQGQP